jgi:Tfp pilus assembly protein PilF
MLREAEEIQKRAVALTPNRASVLYHLGVVQYKLGRKAEAASEMRRALQADRNFPEAEKAREILAASGG